MIIIRKAEELELIQVYIKGNCFDWHEKSQSTNRDTHDWYQNKSMSSNNGRFWWSGSFFKTGTKLKNTNICVIQYSFCMIIIRKAEELELNQSYIKENCFDWHEKSKKYE